MNEAYAQRPVSSPVEQALVLAQTAIGAGDYTQACILLRQQLEKPHIPTDFLSEILSNLAACLCVLAQTDDDQATAFARLAEAEQLQSKALSLLSSEQAPSNQATARVNLGIIHMTRFALDDDAKHLFAAHLALDGGEATFKIAGDVASLDWIRSIRDQLVELRDRRAIPRR